MIAFGHTVTEIPVRCSEVHIRRIELHHVRGIERGGQQSQIPQPFERPHPMRRDARVDFTAWIDADRS